MQITLTILGISILVFFLALVVLRRYNKKKDMIDIPKRLAEIRQNPISVTEKELTGIYDKENAEGPTETEFTYKNLNYHIVSTFVIISVWVLCDITLDIPQWIMLVALLLVIILYHKFISRLFDLKGYGKIEHDTVEIRLESGKVFSAHFSEIKRLRWGSGYRSPLSLLIDSSSFGKYIQIGAPAGKDKRLREFSQLLEKRYSCYKKNLS